MESINFNYKTSGFDTVFDTKNFFVTIKPTFYIRKDKNDTGLSPIYLSLTAQGKRERMNLKIAIDPNKWDEKRQRLKVASKIDNDINLVLDNIISKVTGINTVYRLSNKQLTPELMKQEMLNEMPRVNFCSFFEKCLEDDKVVIKPGSYRRYKAVLNKLKEHSPELYFTDIDLQWFDKYRRYLASIGNKTTTINANIKAIKKYLKAASRYGIRLKFNVEDIESGSTAGNITALNLDELNRLHKYYLSDFIQEHHKLSLGYFLFSCFTGLRRSDMFNLSRKDLTGEIDFIAVKSSKQQIIQLNITSLNIVRANKNLFVEFPHPNVINRQLKDICRFLGVKRNLHLHVGRHTFATSFLRVGGNVAHLQKLLGHTKIETTMRYVHILAQEANEEVFLLDSILKQKH